VAEIVDLDAVVPEDIVFKLAGKQYPIPGDLETEQVFKLMRLFAGLKVSGNLAGVERSAKQLEAGLLDLFQVRQPDLERLPFGATSLRTVTVRVLQLLGVDVGGPQPDPLPEPTPKKPKRAVPKSRSRRSTGSAGSSTPTGGRRKKS
jgi:hypothetical protein